VGEQDLDRDTAVRVWFLGPYAKPLSGYWEIYTVLPMAGWLTFIYFRNRRAKPAPAEEPS
jgi:hypothetical protein